MAVASLNAFRVPAVLLWRDPDGRYIEQIGDESWTEHLRRFDHVTEGDVS